MKEQGKSFSLADLNIQEKCEESVEFEIMDSAGKGMNIFISVIGGHAPAVQSKVNKLFNHRRRIELAQAKRGKMADITPIEDDIEFGIETAVVRMTGWRNITEEFNHENATLLCTINPEIRKQVIDNSDALANLTLA